MKVPSSRKIVLVAFLAGLVFVWGVGAGLYFLASTPASQESRPVIVDIQPGMTLNQVAYQLHDRHLLRSPLAFRLLAYLQNRQNQIQVGEYEIAASMEPREILDKITSGKTLLHAVTIPEGYRVTEIAALLE
ncbi:MAG: aminodeoxychorismate lyase, partial [Nitrospinaceae bacterium]|nr:aminodeoxychorismate lyase [Nitrospinaceae bacterium]NIU95290.1 aminodeoxychorismate lyase [Nitrospinaceae bacterium]NIX33310.1 aminodeoxychorismate lyase [Nitrospinaceae bacterium]NIY13937.1 aminodeoxychorismate lyase [Nitrospinaceae bacterium]